MLYKKHKELRPNSPITLEEWEEMFNRTRNTWVDQLMAGKELNLSGGGMLRIRGQKIPVRNSPDGTIYRKVDYKSTYEMWAKNPELKEKRQLVYFMNNHSDGVHYRTIWSVGKRANAKFYVFDAAAALRRRIAMEVTENGAEFPIENKPRKLRGINGTRN